MRLSETAGYATAVVGFAAFLAVGPLPDLYVLLAALTLACAAVVTFSINVGPSRVPRPASIGWLAVAAGIVVTFTIRLVITGGGAAFERDALGPPAIIALGLWLAAGSVPASPLLPTSVRALGIVAGLLVAATGGSLIVAGTGHPLTMATGVAYEVALPVWGLLVGRHIGTMRAQSATGAPLGTTAGSRPA
ncbi:MAG TPA: hypothetical protein VFJ71_01520 [Candidatus Limnocylindrales bacterium]|nr:hypothetical protein [Candidatus Limnocylindrales bacterium]